MLISSQPTTGKLVAVTAANGRIGRATVLALYDAGVPVRPLVRDAAAARGWLPPGLPAVTADLGDEGALAAGLAGVNDLVLVSPHGPDQADQEVAAIIAAVAAGVQRVVKVSGDRRLTTLDSPVAAGRLHARVETVLAASGLASVVLRPVYFQQNLLEVADTVVTDEVLVSPMGDAALAMIDVRDIAAVAVAVLQGATAEDDLTLSGPVAVTFAELADELSRQLGKEIVHFDAPLDLVRAAIVERTGDTWLAEHLGEIVDGYRRGLGAQVHDTVERLTGRPARAPAAFLAEHRHAFGSA